MKLLVALALVAFVGTVFGVPVQDRKSRQIHHAEVLIKRADEAIKKLEAEKKTQEVEVLKHEEATIKKLIEELKNTKDEDHTKLEHIEHELVRAELKLDYELLKIGHHGHHHEHQHPTTAKAVHFDDIEAEPVTDFKTQLIHKGEELIKEANEAIKQLEPQKKTHEIEILKSEIAAVKKHIDEVEHAKDDDHAKLVHLERQLYYAEDRLKYTLLKLGQNGHHGHQNPTTPKAAHFEDIEAEPVTDVKKRLIHKGEELIKEANEAIKQLEPQKKTHEIEILKSEIAAVKKHIDEVEHVKDNDSAKLVHLERQLLLAEVRLEYTLLKLGQ